MQIYYANKHDFDFSKASPLDAGYDIHTPVDVFLPPGSEVCINTGLRVDMNKMDTPKGFHPHFGLIVPRSSSSRKDVIIKNTTGIIDQSYCGDDDEILIWLKRLEPSALELVGSIRRSDGFNYGNSHYFDYGTMSPQRLNGSEIYESSLDSRDTFVFRKRRPEEKDNFIYKAGDRFAQMVFIQYSSPETIRLEKLGVINRGGFGTTGE